MGVIFDSSEIISLERDRAQVESLVSGRENEPFGISVVTVAELLHGVERADSEARRVKRQSFVEKVIESFPNLSLRYHCGAYLCTHLGIAGEEEINRRCSRPDYRGHRYLSRLYGHHG